MAMTRVLLQQDTIAKFTKTGNTTATLGSLTLTTSVSGVGGLDTGSIAVSTFYYVYTVLSGGVIRLICSTSAVAPTGFGTGAFKVGAFYTDASTNIFKAYFYGEDLVDVFDCAFDATGVVIQQNTPWISGNFAVSGTSNFAGTLVSGIFSVIPNVTGTVNNTTGGTIIYSWMCNCQSLTIVTMKTFVNGALGAAGSYIVCYKQGIDATKPDWTR